MKNKPLFENIAQEIKAQIDDTKHSIQVAVAWITHYYLKDALLMALRRGVGLKIIIMDDELNNKVDWSSHLALGAEIIKISENELGGLMHNKFAVFDTKSVISGSYNWTKRASEANLENAVLFTDSDIIMEYQEQFDTLWQRFSGQTQTPFYLDKALRRFALVKEYLVLDEWEDAKTQLGKLNKNVNENAPQNIIDALSKLKSHVDSQNLTEALATIESLLHSYRTIARYDDPEITRLKLEAQLLEKNIELLRETYVQAEALLQIYQRYQILHLGDLLKKIMRLEWLLFKRKADFTDKAADKEVAKEKEKAFYSFDEKQKEALKKKDIDLTEEQENELKTLYRQCAKAIHPDRISTNDPKLKQKAGTMMALITNAYKEKNLKELKKLQKQVETGEWESLTKSILMQQDKDHLRIAVQQMRATYNEISYKLHSITNAEDYKKALGKANWATYVEEEKTTLKAQLKILETEAEKLKF